MIKIVHKKKDRTECGKYCGISLVAYAGNVLKILATRLGGCCEAKGLLSEEYCGYLPRRSTVGIMFTLRRMQELEREAREPLILCFIGLQKAYNSVDRSAMINDSNNPSIPRCDDSLRAGTTTTIFRRGSMWSRDFANDACNLLCGGLDM